MDLIGGRYSLQSLLGKGAFGEVHLAIDRNTQRQVAVKILRSLHSTNQRVWQRFQREAGTLQALQHPGSIALYDFGQMENGSLFMVMEYCAGRTLREMIDEDEPIKPARALELVAQALEFLEVAHQRGLVHRDLKPANIMVVDENGKDRVKVLDFGMVKYREAEGITKTGSIVGTPMYMSPEQAKNTGELDGRADVYSMGMVLYHMVTGQCPFPPGNPMVIATKHLMEYPALLSEVSPKLKHGALLEPLIFGAIEKDLPQRYSTAAEFARRCRETIPQLKQSTRLQRAKIAASSSSSHGLIIGGGVGAVVLAVLLAMWLNRDPGETPVPGKKNKVVVNQKKGTTKPVKKNGGLGFEELLVLAKEALKKNKPSQAERWAHQALKIKMTPELEVIFLQAKQLRRKNYSQLSYRAFADKQYDKARKFSLMASQSEKGDQLILWIKWAVDGYNALQKGKHLADMGDWEKAYIELENARTWCGEALTIIRDRTAQNPGLVNEEKAEPTIQKWQKTAAKIMNQNRGPGK